MHRDEMIGRVRERAAQQKPWDIAVIGGGAAVGAVRRSGATRRASFTLLNRCHTY